MIFFLLSLGWRSKGKVSMTQRFGNAGGFESELTGLVAFAFRYSSSMHVGQQPGVGEAAARPPV